MKTEIKIASFEEARVLVARRSSAPKAVRRPSTTLMDQSQVVRASAAERDAQVAKKMATRQQGIKTVVAKAATAVKTGAKKALKTIDPRWVIVLGAVAQGVSAADAVDALAYEASIKTPVVQEIAVMALPVTAPAKEAVKPAVRRWTKAEKAAAKVVKAARRVEEVKAKKAQIVAVKVAMKGLLEGLAFEAVSEVVGIKAANIASDTLKTRKAKAERRAHYRALRVAKKAAKSGKKA